MLSKLRSRWLLPIRLGASLGVLIGAYVCGKTPECVLYAGCHFYHLLSQMLVREVDRYALIVAALAAALLAAIYLANRCAGAVRSLLLIILPLGVAALAAQLLFPRPFAAMLQVADNPEYYVWVRTSLGLGWVVVCAVIWLRHRRRRTSVAAGTAPESPPRPPRRTWSRARRVWSMALTWASLLLILLFLGINIAAGAYRLWSPAAVRHRPNIILIMVCSLRADHLGCYGYDLNTSPRLDQFARESTRFAQAIAPSSWTLWSTASILTSRYPERIFSSWNVYAVANRTYATYPALPLALSNMGYATSAVSDHPFFGEAVTASFDYRQGFDRYDLTKRHAFEWKEAPEVTSIALKRVKEFRGRRFFQYLMYGDLHYEYTQHKEFVFGPSRKDTLGPEWASSLAAPVSPAEQKLRAGKLARYNSELGFTDHAIGEYLAGLKELGLYDDSLIIFCADHGEEFLEHGSYGHVKTLYHEVTSVPLLVKFPRQRQGRVVAGKFAMIDLAPSIMKIIGGNYSRLGLHGEGEDLPVLLRCVDKPIFCSTINKARSVMSGHAKYSDMGDLSPWWKERKLAPAARARRQVFDLRIDPGEYQDITPSKPEVASVLTDLLRDHDTYLSKTDVVFGKARPISMADQEQSRERLRALGYLQE